MSDLHFAGNTVPYGYAGKAGAIAKSALLYAGNTVGYGYSACYSSGNFNYGGFRFVVQYTVLLAICGISSINIYYGKAVARGKSHNANAGNAVPYGYAGKAIAIAKSHISNAGNAVRYGYAGKAVAMGKSIILNAGNGTAGKVKEDVFATVIVQRFSGASWSGVKAAKTVHVQLDGIGGVGSIVGLVS